MVTFRFLWFSMLLSMAFTATAEEKPNIILVMMDDVGYGDLSCHGSPVIRTPHIDRLYEQSIRLTNYHTGTTCSPTRAGLLTGRHYDKTGVWHTIIGRSLLRPGIPTLPEILIRHGYSTGIFGKWHLGDNFPMRPQDRGFQYTLIHGGGGIGQTPDYWGNEYFDDTYRRNGIPEKFDGYCTDIWVREALWFVEEQVNMNKPFFCYIPLNAAHQPHRAPRSYVDKYKNNTQAIDPVYNAMVDNIDENMGRIMSRLKELGIEDNTILIFTSDNGTSNKAGVLVDNKGCVTRGYNAGMRGVKAQPYEGGHRVPFFIRYPEQGIKGGRDVAHLGSCLDVLPSLLALCGIKDTLPDIDGEDLSPYMKGKPANNQKTYIADTQRGRYLEKYKEYAVMMGSWRLVNGELFNLATDPGQRRDISSRYPDTVAFLMDKYERWWTAVEEANKACPFVRIPVLPAGRTAINCMDMFPDDDKYTAWNQDMVRREQNSSSGVWKLYFSRAGEYRVTIRQFPFEAGKNELPVFAEPGSAFIKINDQAPGSIKVNVKEAVYTVRFPKGEVDFRAGFVDARGYEIAAQYVYFEKI